MCPIRGANTTFWSYAIGVYLSMRRMVNAANKGRSSSLGLTHLSTSFCSDFDDCVTTCGTSSGERRRWMLFLLIPLLQCSICKRTLDLISLTV